MFQIIPEHSTCNFRLFLNFLERYGMLSNTFKCSVPTSLDIFKGRSYSSLFKKLRTMYQIIPQQSVLQWFGMFWNVPDYSRTFYSVPECSRMLRNTHNSSGISTFFYTHITYWFLNNFTVHRRFGPAIARRNGRSEKYDRRRTMFAIPNRRVHRRIGVQSVWRRRGHAWGTHRSRQRHCRSCHSNRQITEYPKCISASAFLQRRWRADGI